MSSNLDNAELVVKDALLVPTNIGIKEINQELDLYSDVPGLKVFVSGGQVLEEYFPGVPTLRTHDFDLKVVAPTNVKVTPTVFKKMNEYGELIANNLLQRSEDYIQGILPQVQQKIKQEYGVNLLTNRLGKVFELVHPRGSTLWTVMFRLSDDVTERKVPLTDVYVVDPKIIDHYRRWTELPGSDPILSESAGDYYIPYDLKHGVPYAKLGYIIWDTIRMIEDSKKRGLPKLQRYINKRNAILNALNMPNQKLSCDAMKDYVKHCELELSKTSCTVKGKTFPDIDSLILFAVDEGLIPADKRYISRIKDNFDFTYICDKVQSYLD